MTASAEEHRDIYSGMVAKALGQEGYFGEEYRVFAFLSWCAGQTFLEVYEEEDDCALHCQQLLMQGAVVSDMVSRSVRVQTLNTQEKQRLREQCFREIDETYRADFQAAVQALERLPEDTSQIAALAAYVEQASDDGLKQQALVGLLAQAKRYKRLPEAVYQQLASKLSPVGRQSCGTKPFFGFLWQEQEQWQAYSNGYLPAALKKWQVLGKQKKLATPIISQSYPFNQQPAWQMKHCFEQTLRQVFDTAYLKLYECLLTL